MAEPGTGLCSGQAIISDCVKIERADFARHADKHQVRSPAGIAIIDNYQDIYAWQLQEVTRLSVQQPFKHPPGAVIRVRRIGAAAEKRTQGFARRTQPCVPSLRTSLETTGWMVFDAASEACVMRLRL